MPGFNAETLHDALACLMAGMPSAPDGSQAAAAAAAGGSNHSMHSILSNAQAGTLSTTPRASSALSPLSTYDEKALLQAACASSQGGLDAAASAPRQPHTVLSLLRAARGYPRQQQGLPAPAAAASQPQVPHLLQARTSAAAGGSAAATPLAVHGHAAPTSCLSATGRAHSIDGVGLPRASSATARLSLLTDARTGSLALQTFLSTVRDSVDQAAGSFVLAPASGDDDSSSAVLQHHGHVNLNQDRPQLPTEGMQLVPPPLPGRPGGLPSVRCRDGTVGFLQRQAVAAGQGETMPASPRVTRLHSRCLPDTPHQYAQRSSHVLPPAIASSMRPGMLAHAGSTDMEAAGSGAGADRGTPAPPPKAPLVPPPRAALDAASAAPPRACPPAPAKALLDSVERVLADGEAAWQFDAFALSEASGGHALSVLGYYLMHRAGLIQTFKMSAPKLAT